MIDRDEEPDKKYLGAISSDFVKVSDTLKESSYQIRKAGFEYPVFPICKEAVSVGVLLLDKHDLGLKWNYHASFLNEFIQAGLVTSEKKDLFMEVYKDPDEFCCLFVVDKGVNQFVFIPYPVD